MTRRFAALCVAALAVIAMFTPRAGAVTLADEVAWGTGQYTFFRCVRYHESDHVGTFNPALLYFGGPTARNPAGSSSGLYGFIDSTWRTVWVKFAHRTPPTAHAWQASIYDQSLAAGLAFIFEGAQPWVVDNCKRWL